MALFNKTVGQYTSSLYEIARGLLRSRDNQAAKAAQLAEEVLELQAENSRLSSELKTQQERSEHSQQLLDQAATEIQKLREQPISLPADPPALHHSYGPKIISLCLKLAKTIGFRPAVRALKIVFAWLGVDAKIPSWESIRGWACRVGVAELERPIEQADDWIWMSDHSNQIGQEKVLKILGIRVADLPPPGETLRHEHMQVLAVIPGTSWKREDVRREYEKLTARTGAPRFLLTDGATELFESADTLENSGRKTIVLRDMKHFGANIFDRLLGNTERFQKYSSLLGRTRSAVQQTELSHFTPPPQKPKARFMNLRPTLKWGEMVSYHLTNHRSQSRQHVTPERMNEKLGWVRGFRKDLACWNRCQDVMSASIAFINRWGLVRGTAQELEQVLNELRAGEWKRCDTSDCFATELIQFVADSEAKLREGERAWLSTEIVESSFGLFKGLEGQHSKGGFTSLIAAMPIMLTDCTPARVRESLQRVSTKQMKKWVHDQLGTTLASKRATAYREYSPTPPG